MRALLALAVLSATAVVGVPASLAAAPGGEQATVGIDKTVVGLTGPVRPGVGFRYQLTASCSSLTVACQDATVSDTIPSGLAVTELPRSSPTQTVSYDPTSRLLTIHFITPLPAPNPVGSTGLLAGSVTKTLLSVELPTTTTAIDGSVINNTATITASNAAPASDSAQVVVSIPRRVTPIATKSWPDADAVAQSGDQSTITLGVRNGSSSSAQVSELAVSDTSAATFDTHDLVSIGPVVRFPVGADQVTPAVCTQPVGTPCTDAQWIVGAPATGPALALPAGVDPATVTGLRFAFSSSTGGQLAIDPTGGQVSFAVQLRDTTRSTGAALDPTSSQTAQNCAVPSAVDAVAGTVTGASACVSFSVLSRATAIGVAKQYFSDPSGSYSASGKAVAGQSAGVSAVTTVTNASAFAVPSVTITDPSASSASDFTALDVTSARVTFPAGATSAVVLVTCRDGSAPPVRTLTAPPSTAAVAATGCPVTSPPASIAVTFTGHDSHGAPSIAAGASGSLGLHGTLNSAAVAGPVSNCADGAVTSPAGGQGSASGVACANLTVYAPASAVTGTKTGSATTLVPGVPVTFTIHASNSGNLPQANFSITDPPAPTATPNPFDTLTIKSASLSSTPTALASQLQLQVYDSRVQAWAAYDSADSALLDAARGIRVVLASGFVPAGASITLVYSAVLRAGVAANTTVTNCQLTSASAPGVATAPVSACASQQTVTPPATAGSIQKAISPTTLARTITGVSPQTTQVRLRAQNTGNIALKRIVLTDTDAGFFDGVTLTSLDGVQFPPGANRVEVDACTAGCASGAFLDGVPASAPVLPAGVLAADVQGLRFTFTNSAGGYALTPGGTVATSGPCPSATVCFHVAPRTSLRSDPATEVPATLSNTASAAGESALQSPGTTYPFGSATATLQLVSGTPALDVNKTPTSSSAGAGEPIPFTLSVRSSGTAAVPSLVVSDPVPNGLVFDDGFVGSSGGPYSITSTVPAGTSPLPAPVFTVDRNDPSDPNRVTALRWSFPGFALLPGSTLAITYQDTLAPGFSSGQTETNVFGAGTSDLPTQPVLVCTINSSRDGQVLDGIFGAGRYCTSSAQVVSQGGTDVDAQKWVSGTAGADFYNTVTAAQVAPGDPSCPLHTEPDGTQFTRYPCVAQVSAGQDFEFLLQVVNGGNTPVTQVRLADGLPHTGDTGVKLSDEQRDTAWNERPRLIAAPTLNGPGTAQFSYTSDAQLCTAQLQSPPASCAAGDWSPAYSPDALGFQAFVTFPGQLAPGGSFTIAVAMQAPPDLSNPASSLPIAWNSFAHTDFVLEPGDATPVQLPLVEPPKVGVAMPFGQLQISKAVTGTLADSSEVGPFQAAYSCAVTPAGGSPVVVASGVGTFSVSSPLLVPGVPAGALCSVWETDTGGGQSANTSQATALTTVIALTPGQIANVTLVNSFTAATLSVTKRVVNGGAGPYSFTMTCALAGAALSLPAGTAAFTLTADQTRVFALPTGASCTVTEVDLPTLDTVSYGDSSSPITLILAGAQTETITNQFAQVAVAAPSSPAASSSPTPPVSAVNAPPPPSSSVVPTATSSAVDAPSPSTASTPLAYTGVNARGQLDLVVWLMVIGGALVVAGGLRRRV